MAGEQLTIKNANNSFVVDANGVKLTNASIEVTNDRNKIVLNPEVGIQMSVKNPSTGEYDTNSLMFSEKGVLEFSGTLRAATGEFTGKVTANEGEIGGWIIKEDGLRSSNEQVFLDPDGKISADTFNTNSGYIGDWQIDGDTISCGEIKMIATDSKKKYIGGGQWLYTPGKGRMEIGKFIIDANSAGNYYIGGSIDSGFTDINSAQWGMSANNSGLCFYTGYSGGNVKTDYTFKVGNDGVVWATGITFDKTKTVISNWSQISDHLDGWNSPKYGGTTTDFVYVDPDGNAYTVLVKNGLIMGFGAG